jgi:putative membrane protein
MLMKLFEPGVLAFVVKFDQLAEVLVTTLIFVIIGLVFFAIAFFVLEKMTPFSIRKEIEDDQNTALGIVIGSLLIGIAIIIAAAIQG